METTKIKFKDQIRKINPNSEAPDELALIIDEHFLLAYRKAKHLLKNSPEINDVSIPSPEIDIDSSGDYQIGVSEIVIFQDGQVFFRAFCKYGIPDTIEINIGNIFDEIVNSKPSPKSLLIFRSIHNQAADYGIELPESETLKMSEILDLRYDFKDITKDLISDVIETIILDHLFPVRVLMNGSEDWEVYQFCDLKETKPLNEDIKLPIDEIILCYGFTKAEIEESINDSSIIISEDFTVMDLIDNEKEYKYFEPYSRTYAPLTVTDKQ